MIPALQWRIKSIKFVLGVICLCIIVFITVYLQHRKINQEFWAIEYRLRTGDIKGTQDRLNEFLLRHPKHKKGWILFAETLRKQAKYAEARNAIEKYRNLNKNDIQYWIQLAYIEKAKGNSTDVQRLLLQAIKQNNKVALPHLELGNYYLGANSLQSALSEYSTAISFDSKWGVPHLARANALASQNSSDAEKEFEVAFRLQPRDLIEQRLLIRGHQKYADFLFRKGDFELAKQHYKIVLSEPFDFETSQIRTRLIICLLNQGRQDEGYAEFKNHYPFLEQNSQSILFLAYLYCCFGQFDQAKLLLDNISFPTKQLQREALYILIQIYLTEKNYKLGISTAKKIIAMDNKDYLGYALLGLLFRESGQLDDARQAFQKSFSISTTDSYVHVDYAYLLYLENQIESAIQECNNALVLDKDNFEASTLLGDLYFKNNKISDALLFYSKATTVNPFYPGAYYGLYKLYFFKGDNILSEKYLGIFKSKEKQYQQKKFLFLANTYSAKTDLLN